MKANILQPEIGMYIQERDSEKLRELLSSWQPGDINELIEAYEDEEDRFFIFNSLPKDLAAQTFEYLDLGFQKELLETLSYDRIADILNEMSADDRTSLLEDLPPVTVNQLLSMLSPEERTVALHLLGYPEYSVGRLMTPDYVAVKAEWTIKYTLDYIRKHGQNSETLNVIYVVDEKGHLIDDIRVREFLLASPDSRVKDLMDNQFEALHVTDDQERVIDIFKRLNRVAMPVIDANSLLLGIVTIDDVLDVVQEEDTEDIQKLGAVEALEFPYMDTPLITMVRKRAVWLVVLFLGEMLTATAMGYFENEIAKAVVLALFVPLIISSGGNSGSQAATLIIRAMALGEISLADWWKVARREIMSGLILGLILGVIGFFRIALWSAFSNIYGPHWPLVGLSVGISLIGVVLWGTLSGSMLPILLKKLGLDPATSSAPFVATLVDVTGLVIYFTIAFFIMRGTLL
jgi:magnesium transporter